MDTLFSGKNDLCFLAGSDISLDPPSCLPTGFQFINKLLELIIPDAEREGILELTNPERETVHELSDFFCSNS
ncbi:MAG: hypothetical protein ACFFD4_38895 [Candidatus Odinarchaeota archaeon]